MSRLSILAATTAILLFAIPQTCAQDGAGDVCSGIDCQQGSCVPLSNTSYPSNILSPYLCACKPGWKTVEGLLPSLPHLLTLPCTVPNCTLNIGCNGSPAAPLQSQPALEHISSPCSLPGICGKGDCEVTDTTKYPPMFRCNCHSGYANIFNLTAGYCLEDCEVGANCHALGITLGSSRSAGSHDASVESSLQIIFAVVATSCLALLPQIVLV
jgi:hypothetical protein